MRDAAVAVAAETADINALSIEQVWELFERTVTRLHGQAQLPVTGTATIEESRVATQLSPVSARSPGMVCAHARVSCPCNECM